MSTGHAFRILGLFLLVFILCIPPPCAADGSVPDSLLKLSSGFAVFVDKNQQKIYVFQSITGKAEKVFEAPCSTGKARGAKAAAGDAKTPNGIFFATRYAAVPDANSTYGSMVFYLDYPNLLDRRNGRNGDNIWIHGTNKPLQPNQSNGCVVMRNPDIENLSRYIFLGKTPIVIAESIKWVSPKENRAVAEELERLARLWAQTMIEGDWSRNNGLYLQEGMEPLPQRKSFFQKAAHLKVAKWHFDVLPRDMTICKLGYTAVVLFDQTLALKSPDTVQSTYVKLYLEQYSTGWFLVENVKPAPAAPRREPVAPIRLAAVNKAETAPASGTPKAEREVAQLIERWTSSWERGRMDRYAACYAPNFRAQGKNLKAWVAYKQDLNKRFKNIRVRVENLRVNVRGDKATATFKQHYSASNLKSSGLKRLDLVRVGGEWKIARETIAR